MATDKKISQLSSGAPAQGTDETVIARGGSNFKLTVAQVVGYLGSPVTVANGGTGQSTYTDGQLLIGNSTGNTLSKNTLTAGSGISITNGTGTITIASTVTDPIPSGSVMLFMQTAAPTGWTKSTTHDNKALRVVSGSASSGGSVDFTTAFASQAVNGTISSTTATNQATTATNQNTTATNTATTATNQATTATNVATTATNQNTTAGGSVSTSVSGSVSGGVGNTTLGTGEMPSHAHSISNMSGAGAPNGSFNAVWVQAGTYGTNNEGGSGAHGHSWSGSWSGSASSSFSGSAHSHTQDSHNHTQNSHNHTQDSHNHTQNAHTHTQDAHNHTQDSHNHGFTGTAINLAVQYVDVIVATKN